MSSQKSMLPRLPTREDRLSNARILMCSRQVLPGPVFLGADDARLGFFFFFVAYVPTWTMDDTNGLSGTGFRRYCIAHFRFGSDIAVGFFFLSSVAPPRRNIECELFTREMNSSSPTTALPRSTGHGIR